MKVNAETLSQAIAKGKENIEKYPLETTVGTKKLIKEYHQNAIIKRNEYVNKQIEIFENCKQLLINTLKERYEKSIPVNNKEKYDEQKKQLGELKKVVEYCNEFSSSFDKLGFKKIIVDMADESISLEEVNNSIKKVFEIFKSCGIELTIENFNYSMFSYNYIKSFIQNIPNPDFNNNMEKAFDDIYWECPDIINHIRLNIMYLLIKYTKNLNALTEQYKTDLLNKNNVNNGNYLQNYNNLYLDLKTKVKCDSYINLNKFLNKELNISDYLVESQQRMKTFNKFLNGKFFAELNETEVIDYYDLISKLNDTVDELTNYYYFEPIMKDIVERYKKKDSYKGIYNGKLKEVQKEEKVREKIYNKYLKLIKKSAKKDCSNEINLVKVEINEQIKKLSSLYNELDEAKLNDLIVTYLNDGSTIYDAFLVANSFYGYLKQMFKKNFPDEKKDLFYIYFKFCYNPNIDFEKKINMLTDYNIIEMVYDKYKLLGIELNREELEKDNIKVLESETDMIQLVKYLENSEINIEKIEIMTKIKKVMSE